MSSAAAYRLRPDEPLPEGVARVARGRIDNAIDELQGRTDSSPAQSVHTARKDMKKLRALVRLVRDELGDEVYRRELAAFRDTGRELAGLRDADVMIETLESLELSGPDAGPPRQALEAHKIRTAAGAREQAAARAVEILSEARGRVDDWPLATDGFGAFEGGLLRMYRRGRRAMGAARRDPSAESLHEWRKRAKDLWYHLLVLEAAWPPVMKALADEAHELSDRLGDDHDLAVLVEWTREHADARAMEEGVEERRRALQADAFAYGERLYADKPRAFVRRIGRWWDASAGAARAETAHHDLS